jgi:hypothetical protein
MSTINYNAGVPRLPDKWHNYISSLLDQARIESITISSTYRTPESQARAMFTNATARGAESQLKLYQAPGQKVIQSFILAKSQNLPESDTLRIMEDTINKVGAQYISAHLRPPSDKFAVIDVPPWSVPEDRRFAFIDIMQKNASKFIDPVKHKGEPVYHIEFGGVKPIVKTTGAALLILALLGGGAIFFFKHYRKYDSLI